MKEVFTKIYLTNKWGSKESRSGKGSTLEATKELREWLPKIIKNWNIKSVLDLPCGDYNYMKELDLDCEYIGGDIVNELIASNSIRYPDVDFRVIDIVNDELPKSDLIIVRDCFVHLHINEIKKALVNISKSCKYMLVTSFPSCEFNQPLETGGWRRLNMEYFPFNLEPIFYVWEGDSDERYKDKSMIFVEL